jgi:hypothetical protein
MPEQFDLGFYFNAVESVVESKYGEKFLEGRAAIEQRFKEIRSGARRLGVDDVMSIFDPSLPFARDWTTPDRKTLAEKMGRSNSEIGTVIHQMKAGPYEPRSMAKVLACFRELSLTSLVLHHVYPERFAICSHHIGSLLHITGPTVADYYLAYCEELKEWSTRQWPTRGVITVVDAEFSLWAWYRLAYADGRDRGKHRKPFAQDRWIQARRATRIAASLASVEALDLARSYLQADPTVSAIIAWRELEVTARTIVEPGPEREHFNSLVDRLDRSALPSGMSRNELKELWGMRNSVMHNDIQMESGSDRDEVAWLVARVTEFVDWNSDPH